MQSGDIANHLDLVSHNVRTRLDELKRQELERLRNVVRMQIRQRNGKGPFTVSVKALAFAFASRFLWVHSISIVSFRVSVRNHVCICVNANAKFNMAVPIFSVVFSVL